MSGGLMSCGLKSGGLMSGGLKSYHREQKHMARRYIKHVDTAWSSGRHRAIGPREGCHQSL